MKHSSRINLNKPIYIGTSILLDFIKVFIQDFCYKHTKNKYGDKAEMLLTNTDSLMYKIESKNVYEESHKYKELFDFSKDPKGLNYSSNVNNLVELWAK